MKNKRAFSLIELLIGLVVMGFVTAGAVSVMGAGQTLALRQVSSGVRLNTERFTLESIYYELRKGGNLAEVEVLDSGAVPDTATSHDKYIFLVDDGNNSHRAMLRTYDNTGAKNSRDTPLTGADGIKTLSFDLPAAIAPVAENYILSVGVTANRVNYTDDDKDTGGRLLTERTAKRGIGLLGMPAKNGSVGNAVHFRFREVVATAETILPDLSIWDNVAKTLVPSGTSAPITAKGLTLLASYDVDIAGRMLPEDKIKVTYDHSGITWWISDGLGGEFRITDAAGSPITGKTCITGDSTISFDVRDASGVRKQLASGSVYFIIDITIPSGHVLVSGGRGIVLKENGIVYTVESPKVPMKTLLTGDPDFFKEMIQDGVAGAFGGGKGTVHKTADGKYYRDSKVEFYPVGNDFLGFKLVSGRGQTGGTKFLYKLLEKRHFDKVCDYEGIFRKISPAEELPYTNIANYSIVFDLAFEQGGKGKYKSWPTAFVLCLNGYISADNYQDGKSIKSHGFAIRHGVTSGDFAAHYYKGGYPDPRISETDNQAVHIYGLKKVFPTSPSPSDVKPSDLENSKFKSTRDISEVGKRRVMYTVLEYIQSGDVTLTPRFIVRTKILDAGATIADNDIFSIGKNFHNSEPAWFGDFKGASTDASKNVLVRNFDSPNGFSMDISPYSGGGLYGLKTVVYKGDAMVANQLPMKAEKRVRYFGYGITITKNEGETIQVHSSWLAPGFTPEELHALLPAGARLLSLNELYDDNPTDPRNELSELEKTKNLNTQLASENLSDFVKRYTGRGVTDIQYDYYVPYYLMDPIPN